jgi:hypothetical protein
MKKFINAIILAFTSCAGNIAANIAKDCDNPQVGGYTGRGLLIPLSNTLTFAVDASNPRIVTGITMAVGDKLAVIDNVWPSAFTDSVTQSNGDAGRLQYGKTFSFRIPLRGAGVSKDIVEPLADAPLGYMAVLEKKTAVATARMRLSATVKACRSTPMASCVTRTRTAATSS